MFWTAQDNSSGHRHAVGGHGMFVCYDHSRHAACDPAHLLMLTYSNSRAVQGNHLWEPCKTLVATSLDWCAQRFMFTLGPNQDPLPLSNTLTLSPKYGVSVHVQRRS